MEAELFEQFRKMRVEAGSLRPVTKAIKAAVTATAKDFFQEKFTEIFAKHPKVNSVDWTAYTPGFNDGDPCNFTSTHEYPSINDNDGHISGEGEEDREEIDRSAPAALTEAEEDAASVDIIEFLKEFDDDDMESMFGNDVLVIVRPTGVEVKEYECGY